MPLTKPRAYQIYDIDYKQAVRVVTISNVVLSGGAPNSVDGVNLSLNDRILVTGQTNAVQNGIYYVTALGTGSNGTWARSGDTDATGELLSGTIVMVTEGNTYADTQWKLTTNDPITIGVTALTFVQNYLANSISFGQTSFSIGSSNANATVSVAGTSNVAVFSTTGVFVTGLISVTGNITSGNILPTAIYTDGYYYANGVPFSGGGGGGGGTPGGANTQIQFNDGGSFGGSAALTFNKTSNAVTASANITGGNIISLGTLSTVGRPTFGAITLPNVDGTSNQLLATYGNGSLYFASVNAGNILAQTFTGNGVQTIFTLSSAPPSINSTFVSYNGVLLLRSSYSVSGANITFTSAPANGSSIEVTTVNPGSGGVSGTPTAAGTDTQVQFNDGGIFGASANLTFNKTSSVFTAKNLASGGSINETVYTITDGASVDLDPVNGTVQLWTLGASRTPTASNFSSGQSMTLMVTANVYSITWTSVGVNWIGNSAPTLASTGNTVIVLWKVSSTVYGALSGTA